MTGLLIKELLFRGVIQKILIVTPGGLTKEWAEEELLGKFGLHAPIVNRASFDAEAHKLSAYEYGSKLEEGARYKAIKELAQRADHLLFLTAVPCGARSLRGPALFEVMPRDGEDWKLVMALLGERDTLRAEAWQAGERTSAQPALFEETP